MTLFCRETLFCEVCFSPEEKELCLTRWCQPTAAVCLQGARMGRNGGAELEPQSAVLIFLWGAEMKPQLPEKMAQAVSKEKMPEVSPEAARPSTESGRWQAIGLALPCSPKTASVLVPSELFAWSPQCLESRWWKRVTSLWRFHVLRQECRTSITGSRNSHTLKWAGKKSTQGGVGPELRQTLLHLLTPRWGDVVLPQKGEKQRVNRGCCRDLWRNPTSCPSGT